MSQIATPAEPARPSSQGAAAFQNSELELNTGGPPLSRLDDERYDRRTPIPGDAIPGPKEAALARSRNQNLGIRFASQESGGMGTFRLKYWHREADMLVLTRKPGEAVTIGHDVEVYVVGVKSGRVKLGFRAPRDVAIQRAEVASLAEFSEHNTL